MSIKSFLFAAAVSVSAAAAHATPIELVTNGGFETGNFTGWTAVNNGGTSGCGTNVWVVNSTGQNGCTNNGKTMAAPVAGTYAAYNTFDGQAGAYTLTQAILLPGSIQAATLSFFDEYNLTVSGTARTFSVGFYDATGATLLGTVYSKSIPTSTQAWTNHTFDVSTLLGAQAGKTVNLRFTETIPTGYAGPGGFGLDKISLQAEVPEPASISLLGLGLLGFVAARRKSARK